MSSAWWRKIRLRKVMTVIPEPPIMGRSNPLQRVPVPRPSADREAESPSARVTEPRRQLGQRHF